MIHSFDSMIFNGNKVLVVCSLLIRSHLSCDSLAKQDLSPECLEMFLMANLISTSYLESQKLAVLLEF